MPLPNANYATQGSSKVAAVWSDDYAIADEGNFFVTTNPTPGTAIATTSSVVDDAATASSTHAQFAPVAIVYNKSTPGAPGAANIYLRWLLMTISQVPTSATGWKCALRLDNVIRYASGGSTLAPVNVNPNQPNNSQAAVYFGAIVPTALPSGNSRLVANFSIDSAVPVINDAWFIKFGASAVSMDQLNGGTTAKNMTYNAPPVVIPPGWSLSLEMWGASNAAAPSWEFTFAHVERATGL